MTTRRPKTVGPVVGPVVGTTIAILLTALMVVLFLIVFMRKLAQARRSLVINTPLNPAVYASAPEAQQDSTYMDSAPPAYDVALSFPPPSDNHSKPSEDPPPYPG